MNSPKLVHRVLFVCHGNICRSTMAQSVMAHLAREAGAQDLLLVDSAATSGEEVGNPVHPGTVAALRRHGIDVVPHRARRMSRAEYADWDRIVYMDAENRRGLMRILGADPQGRLSRLLEWSGACRDVADPWYTGDFEATFSDVMEGCQALLDDLLGW